MGKSTVAVNLAYELAARGGRIGLLDLDLYGPSLPTLVQPHDRTIRRSPLGPGMVYPIYHEGVKVLSLGFVHTEVRVAPVPATNAHLMLRAGAHFHPACLSHLVLYRAVFLVVVRRMELLS